MNIKTIHLKADQHLDDINMPLNHYLTHIEGGTGIGKSTFLLNVLALRGPLLMAVPTLSQLRQLKSSYNHREDLIFVSGKNFHEAMNYVDFEGKTIVCIYDQLYKIKQRLTKEEIRSRTLVIDEAHKLYQAGGYRGTAIHNLLVNIRKREWLKVVTVSATFSKFLVTLANLNFDQWITVIKPDRPTRNIKALYYARQDIASWPEKILEVLEDPERKGTVIVRINAKRQIEELFHAYTAAGYHAQKIYSDIQDEQSVKDLLEAEKIQPGVDVLLTTSLIDEAINLKNHDSDIHSIHIIGSRTHTEEIAQFAGRLRAANPPIYLHLNAADLVAVEPKDEVQTAINLNDCIQEYVSEQFAHGKAFAECLSVLVNNKCFKSVDAYQQCVDEINATHRRHLDVAPLRFVRRDTVAECRVMVNICGFLAQAYREEAENVYGAFHCLTTRLHSVLPGCIVEREIVTLSSRREAIKDLFEAGEEQAKAVINAARQEVERTLRQKVVSAYSKGLQTEAGSLARQFGQHTLKGSICQQYALLAPVLPDFDEVARAVRDEQVEQVLDAFTDLNDDLIKNIHHQIGLKGLPRHINCDAATKIVIAAAQQVIKNDPKYKDGLDSFRGQKTGLRTKANNHVTVDRRTALSLIRNCTHTETKKRKRGTTTVLGLYWGNYHYAGFNPPCLDGSSARGSASEDIQEYALCD
jgi:hypothetical protein